MKYKGRVVYNKLLNLFFAAETLIKELIIKITKNQ